MSIVKNTNKKTGITYVYESESYWDPVKKQPRNRRKLIGRLDSEGNVVPTGTPGRKKREKVSSASSEDGTTIDELNQKIQDLEGSLKQYELKLKASEERIKKLEKEKAHVLAVLSDLMHTISV